MNHPFDIIMIPMQFIVAFFTLYYFFIAFFGLFRRKETKMLVPKHSFAILISAHNEENVVGHLIENLHVLNYPRDLFDIYVTADNCSDKTAYIARNQGAIVFERFNLEKRGKGYAMEWAFTKLFSLKKQYDAVVVFDADNIVHPEFLMEMNSRLIKGEKVIQGYIDAKNPTDTWISGTFAICFWLVNHVWHLAKYHLGLSSALGGTGMCISTDVLKQHGWGATCLTEDLEFSMKCLLEGIPTTWAHDAIVYDEKPLTFMQSWYQRKRWAQGHFDVAARYIPRLFSEGIRLRDIRLLDAILHLVQPHFLLLSTAFIISSYVYYWIPFYSNIIYMVMPLEVWLIIGVGQYIFPLIILAKIKAAPKMWLYMIVYPIFIYSWIPITFLGYLHRNDRRWSHTTHSRGLSYQEVLGTFPKESDFSKQVAK